MKSSANGPAGLNPRGRKHDKKPESSRFRLPIGSPLGYLLLVFLGFLFFRNAFQDVGTRRVTYSEFKDALRKGQFAKVQISNDWVKGFLKENTVAAPAGEQTPRSQPSSLPWLAHRVPGDDELVKLLDQQHVDYEAVPSSAFGDAFWVWLMPLVLAVVFLGLMMRRMGGLGQGPQSVMSFGKTRAKIQSESNTGVGFKDVAGIDEAVEELREIVEFLKTPEKFRRLGGRIPKGVLLVGPPGTGKTLLARAVAGGAGVPFFSLSGSEFVEMFVGVGAARVRDLFAQASAKAPCIIFIDELDAIGKSRNGGVVAGHDEREQTLNQLLAEMDGFDAKTGLIILAATNRPEILDSALLRPGRFDRHVLVDRPDKRGREQILQIHAREVKLGPDVDLKSLASRTPGFVGADLANVVNEAALLAARKGHDAVMNSDFEEAIERVVAGLEKKNRRMNEHEKEIVAHHEAGHAVVNWLLPHAEPVHKVSIIPRGLAALGYTMSLPLEDRYLMSLDELKAKIAGMMGGRAAEEIFIGEVSTGASNDFKQATEIARMMVREYGMSDALGPVALGQDRASPFLRASLGSDGRDYSEQTARMVDEEIRSIVQQGLETARSVLREHKDKVDAVAARLLASEVVEEEELRHLLGTKATVPTHPPANGEEGHSYSEPPGMQNGRTHA